MIFESFFSPLNYLFESRLRTFHSKISWILIYVIPQFLLFTIDKDISAHTFIQFLLLFLSFFSFYECGYLVNDFISTKKESTPNVRLSVKRVEALQDKVWKLVFIKCLLGLIFLGLYSALFSLDVDKYVIIWGACLVFFALHNWIRSRWNCLTYLFLCFTKYIAFLDFSIGDYLVVLVIFPLLRSLEHSMKDKYLINYPEYLKNLDLNRVVYYSVLSLILLYIAKQGLFIIALYYLCVRTSFYLILKSNIKIQKD